MTELLNRDAVLLAEVCLRLDSARQYGLITGGPEVDVERCEDVIVWGREQGFTFSDDEIQEAAGQFFAEHNAEVPGE